MIDRLQISQNCTTTPTKIPERSPLQSTQQHFQRARCHFENLHESILIILPARPLPGYQDARTNLLHLPAEKESNDKANPTSAITNPRTTKLEDPC